MSARCRRHAFCVKQRPPPKLWPRSKQTLILTGTKDLLNPDFEPKEAAKNIADVKVVTISPGTVRGHATASVSVSCLHDG